MPFSAGFTLQKQPPTKPRTPRGERPDVPEGGDIRVSDLGLAQQIIDQQGGAEGVLAAADTALTRLVAKWVDAAGLYSQVGDISLTSRKDFDRGTLGEAHQIVLRGQIGLTGLVVCRDSARIRAVRAMSGEPQPTVEEAIYAQVRAGRTSWQPKNVYASNIKNDARHQVFTLLGIPESDPVGENNPEWAAVAEFGTALHDIGEGWLKQLGILKRAEFRVRSRCGSVTGRGDAELQMADDTFIADLKTVGRRDFDQGAHGRKFDKYIAQLNVYGSILGLRKGMVILFCRDSGRMQEFIINLRPSEGAALIARAQDIMCAVRAKIVLPSESAPRDQMFNPYRTLSKLEDETGWVQRALDDGVDPKTIAVETLHERYGVEEVEEVRQFPGYE